MGKDIIDKLAAALDKALDNPVVQQRLADLGGSLPSKEERTPARFNGFVRAEIARWSPILKAANIEGSNDSNNHPGQSMASPLARGGAVRISRVRLIH